MTVENIKSTKVMNLEAAPSVVSDIAEYGNVLRSWEDTITTTGTTSTNGSTYDLMPLPSTARLRLLDILGVGSVDLPNMDVGLRHESGTPYDDDCIATALDIDDTGSHLAISPAISTSDPTKMLWEYMDGVTSDPGGLIYISLSLDADAVAAGVVKVRAEGSTSA